jgi:hypothetical protein
MSFNSIVVNIVVGILICFSLNTKLADFSEIRSDGQKDN